MASGRLRSMSLSVNSKLSHVRSIIHPSGEAAGFAVAAFIPLYLSPILMSGTKTGQSVYCILLTLLLLVSDLIPCCAVAFLPTVVVPLFGILAPDELAAQYLSGSVLKAISVFSVGIALESGSTLLERAALRVLALFGLKVHSLFVFLLLGSLLVSVILPSSSFIILATVAIEKFLEDMEADVLYARRQGSIRKKPFYAVRSYSHDSLLERLAETVGTMTRTRTANDQISSSNALNAWDSSLNYSAFRNTDPVLDRKISLFKRPRAYESYLISYRKTAGPSVQTGQGIAAVKEEQKKQQQEQPATSIPAKSEGPVKKHRASGGSFRSLPQSATDVKDVQDAHPDRQSQAVGPPDEHLRKRSRRPSKKRSIRRVSVKETTGNEGSAANPVHAPRCAEVKVQVPNEQTAFDDQKQMEGDKAVFPIGPRGELLIPNDRAKPKARRKRSVRKTSFRGTGKQRSGHDRTPPGRVPALPPRGNVEAGKTELVTRDVADVTTSTTEGGQASFAVAHIDICTDIEDTLTQSLFGISLLSLRGRPLRGPPSGVAAVTSDGALQQGPEQVVPVITTAGENTMARRPSILKVITGGEQRPSSEKSCSDTVAPARKMSLRFKSPPATSEQENSAKKVGGRSPHQHEMDEEDSRRIRSMVFDLRKALLLGATLAAVFGNMVSLMNVPAMKPLLENFQRVELPMHVNSWNWGLINLPVTLAASVFGYIYIYFFYIVNFDMIPDEKLQHDIGRHVRNRLNSLGQQHTEDIFMLYFMAVFLICNATIFHGGYTMSPSSSDTSASDNAPIVSHLASFGRISDFPFAFAGVLLVCVAPQERMANLWTAHRILTWNMVRRRMPWVVLCVYGSVCSLSKIAEEHNVVQSLFQSFGPQFWASQSPVTNQFIMSTLAAIFSEIINNSHLNELIMPVIFDIAYTSKIHPVLLAIPVGVAASSNLILPASLPVVMLRVNTTIPLIETLISGLVLKSVVVAVVILSTNTVGNLMFEYDQLPAWRWQGHDNVTGRS